MATILLIEDNEMNRDMLCRRLQRSRYDVIVAVDGEDGIRVANEQSPDLIIMDMSLPIMDGWQATRLLKQSSSTQDIPVIGLSAHAMAGDKEKAIEAGCDDYDTKPVDMVRLLEKIGKFIEL
ncbi:MAG: response regulator [Gammaproteobacteria bacterium]|nr:MAG: response regulator [Gammaproteobacteria bacterium]